MAGKLSDFCLSAQGGVIPLLRVYLRTWVYVDGEVFTLLWRYLRVQSSIFGVILSYHSDQFDHLSFTGIIWAIIWAMSIPPSSIYHLCAYHLSHFWASFEHLSRFFLAPNISCLRYSMSIAFRLRLQVCLSHVVDLMRSHHFCLDGLRRLVFLSRHSDTSPYQDSMAVGTHHHFVHHDRSAYRVGWSACSSSWQASS